MDLVCISTVPTGAITRAVSNFSEKNEIPLTFKVYSPHQFDADTCDYNRVTTELQAASVVLVDIRGMGPASDLVIRSLRDTDNTVISLMGPYNNLFSITRLGNLIGKDLLDKKKGAKKKQSDSLPTSRTRPADFGKESYDILRDFSARSDSSVYDLEKDARNYNLIIQYWRHGGEENYYNLVQLLFREYGSHPSLPLPSPPVEYPSYGIYHPDLGFFEEIEEYQKAAKIPERKPVIGVMFHSGMHLEQNIPTIREFIRQMPDCAIIPVYSNPEHNLHCIEHFFLKDNKPVIDALVNLKYFRLNGGPLGGDPALTNDLLTRLNVPVFAPLSMFSQDLKEWEENVCGISPVLTIMAVVWPELDGCIEPIPCCGLHTISINGNEAKEVGAIPERIGRITRRINNWIRLKNVPNEEKKVAIIIYNYPPGEASLAGASYLDVFVSVKKMLETLRDEGYTVDIPSAPLHTLFEERKLYNSPAWSSISETAGNADSFSTEAYLKFFHSLPDSVREDLRSVWGEPPGTIMVHENNFVIPGIHFGNVFVGIQPARPPLTEEDIASAAHDKTKPPHHQYVGFYRWLQDEFQADLVFHVGTHGLAEFTKGKEIGMSNSCFPDILIGDIPHLYIYSVTNTSEATIAKRRLYGTMLSYNSPPFSTSDLYEQYLDLEHLLEEHDDAVRMKQEVRIERVEEKIWQQAESLHIQAETIPEIHEMLYDMKRSIIPKGLHILGEKYGNEDLKGYLECLLRYDRGEASSLNRILAESEGIDYNSAIRNRQLYARQLDIIDARARQIVSTLIDQGVDPALDESLIQGQNRERLQVTLTNGIFLARDYADNGNELKNCIRGLQTEFIRPATGGDVIRKPDVLPTGFNINQFDPTKVPTETAVERGDEIAKNTLNTYLEQEGSYPESIGMVLWGFETSNTGGETIGQILSYLGVRVKRGFGSWNPELQLIPLEELKRPRIDVHLSICGFFRDMFPNIISLLNKALALVSEQDESDDMNYIKKHSEDNLKDLKEKIESGILSERRAKKIAYGRLYGPRAGEYGTRILPLLEDSIWKEEKDLADVYLEQMSHLYTDGIHGEKSPDSYRKNLSHVKIVSQIRDRNDREIIDLDHYFEYFGGLTKAVETVSGQTPVMLISDTTKEVIETAGIEKVISRGVRTRLLNPKWIDEMLKHDFHGTQQIEERVYNTLGLAATTHSVENWIWSSIADRFIFNEEMRERLMENNRYSALGLAERLLEAEQRGYWNATEEEMNKLRDAFLEMEGHIEERL